MTAIDKQPNINNGDAREFLSTVVPWDLGGYVTIHWHLRDQPFLGKSCRTVDDAMSVVADLKATTRHNIYFCISHQKLNSGNRDRENALGFCCIPIDIDVKRNSAKHYGTMSEALAALYNFCINHGLPRPSLLVRSGGGLHVYWLSDRVLTVDEWQPYANGLKRAARDFGLKFDPACTGDAARVLRVPGTLNYKYDPPRPVSLLQGPNLSNGDRHDFAAVFGKLLNKKAASPSAKCKIEIAPGFKDIELTPSGIDDYDDTPLPFPPIKAECGWLREAHDTGGKDHDQPQWHLAVLAATFLENGHELAHQLSNQHDDYGRGEKTEEMWDRKIRERKEKDLGWPSCKAIEAAGSEHCKDCPHFKEGRSPLHLALAAKGVTRADFRAYLPDHSYIFTPTGAFWSMAGVNACLPPTVMLGQDGEPLVFKRGENKGQFKVMKATVWLDSNQPVHHLTWAPGHPMLIENRLVVDGGWIERNGVTTYNLYRPPTLRHGDPSKAGPWLELVHKVYPEDAERLIPKLAHRVQRPGEKINHAVVLGGAPGIGKDTILEPVKRAIGAWNFKETSPQQILGRFNGFLQSVIMRISEVRDLGDFNRYQFYEHTKVYFAAPPDVLRVDEKNIPEHDIMNCTFAILTTNRLTDGIFLPPDDRRHDVIWSELTKDDFEESYWNGIWSWYAAGGDSHVAAYLATLDISAFDPKAPPPKTTAFWSIVNANRTAEEGELQDILDQLGNPDVVTIEQIKHKAPHEAEKYGLREWLGDRKNRKAVHHRLENCGYRAVNNPAAKDGLWRIDERRQVVYAKNELTLGAQREAAETMQRKAVEEEKRKAAVTKEREAAAKKKNEEWQAKMTEMAKEVEKEVEKELAGKMREELIKKRKGN